MNLMEIKAFANMSPEVKEILNALAQSQQTPDEADEWEADVAVEGRALIVSVETAEHLSFYNDATPGILLEMLNMDNSERKVILSTQGGVFTTAVAELLHKELPFEIKQCLVEVVHQVTILE